MLADYYAWQYDSRPPGESFEDDDFDLDDEIRKMEEMDPDDWEKVI